MDDVLDDEETEEETEEELNRVSRTLLLTSIGSFCFNILSVSLCSSSSIPSVKKIYRRKGLEQCKVHHILS